MIGYTFMTKLYAVENIFGRESVKLRRIQQKIRQNCRFFNETLKILSLDYIFADKTEEVMAAHFILMNKIRQIR